MVQEPIPPSPPFPGLAVAIREMDATNQTPEVGAYLRRSLSSRRYGPSSSGSLGLRRSCGGGLYSRPTVAVNRQMLWFQIS